MKCGQQELKIKSAMNIGLKLWSSNLNYIEEAKKLYIRGIFDYLELFVEQNSSSCISEWKSCDIPIVLHAPHSHKGLNLSLKEAYADNGRAIDAVEAYAVELLPRFIIFHPGVDGDLGETIRQIQVFKRSYWRVFENALIENKPKTGLNGERCMGSSPDEIQTLTKETGLGFCLDIGHAIVSAAARNQWWKELVESFLGLQPKMFHLSDGDMHSERDMHLHLGQGNFDIDTIVRLIEGPGCMMSLETPKTNPEDLDDFLEDINYLKAILR